MQIESPRSLIAARRTCQTASHSNERILRFPAPRGFPTKREVLEEISRVNEFDVALVSKGWKRTKCTRIILAEIKRSGEMWREKPT